MLEDIKKNRDVVLSLMTTHHLARNSDKALVLMVWEREGLKLTREQIEIYHKHCSPAASITRPGRDIRKEAKDKIEKDNDYSMEHLLSDKQIQEMKDSEEERIREHFRNKKFSPSHQPKLC